MTSQEDTNNTCVAGPIRYQYPGRSTLFEGRTHSVEQTMDLAATFAQHLKAGDLILLCGMLGVGKTCFVRGLCRGLGMASLWDVDSPTFTLVNVYQAGPGVNHVDLYRLEQHDHMARIDLDDLLDGQSITVIEWPERLPGLPAPNGFLVRIEVVSGHESWRDVTIRPFSSDTL